VLLQDSPAVIDGRFAQAKRSGRIGDPGQPGSVISTTGAKKTAAPKRVLVVEDNLDSVHSLALLLHDMGHIVEYAINGYVALSVARRFHPDFLLLDLGLPGMDGFEVCREIKRDPTMQGTRIIAITAFSQAEYRTRAAEAGCELYLVKPVATNVLEELLG
jgi:two-component system, chemotaxis family, CheB/CheR fusion protein